MSTPSVSSRHASTGRLASWSRRRPLATFVLVAFAVSWVLWGLALPTESWLLLFLGGLGPAAGGALVAWQQGTLRQWWSRVVRWRVAPGWYALVLLVPVLIWGSANLWLELLGREPSLPEIGALVPAYVGTWIGTLFLGGLEEPGWRGFAQPHLQQRLSSVRATLVVGVIWGLWHLPIEPLAILVTVPLAFLYAWLLNRTGSVLLCILLHASITPAQDHLIPTPVTLATHAVVGATLVAVALAITVVTRGRLGLPAPTPATAVGQLAPGQNQAAGL